MVPFAVIAYTEATESETLPVRNAVVERLQPGIVSYQLQHHASKSSRTQKQRREGDGSLTEKKKSEVLKTLSKSIPQQSQHLVLLSGWYATVVVVVAVVAVGFFTGRESATKKRKKRERR